MSTNDRVGRKVELNAYKMFVYIQADGEQPNSIGQTVGIIVPEFSRAAKDAADEAYATLHGLGADVIATIGAEAISTRQKLLEEDYEFAAVLMDVSAEGPMLLKPQADGLSLNLDDHRVGLAVLEETDDASPLLPNQDEWADGIRVLEWVEFDDDNDITSHFGEIDPKTEFPIWLAMDRTNLLKPVVPTWGKSFKVHIVSEAEVEMSMTMDELLSRGLVAASVPLPPKSSVLVLEEGKPPVAYVVDAEAEATPVDARRLIDLIVEAQMHRTTDLIERSLLSGEPAGRENLEGGDQRQMPKQPNSSEHKDVK